MIRTIVFFVMISPISAADRDIQAAKQFEAFFFKQILKSLWKNNTSFFGDKLSGDIFKDIWIEAVAQSCSSKSLGIFNKVAPKMGLRSEGVPGKHYDKRV